MFRSVARPGQFAIGIGTQFAVATPNNQLKEQCTESVASRGGTPYIRMIGMIVVFF